MDLYGAESRSVPQKTLSIVIEIALLYVSWRILFGDWGVSFAHWMHWPQAADWNRRVAVLAFNLIVFARTTFMMLVLLKRKMPLEEAISVPFAFTVYYLGFALFALRTARPLGADGVVGIALFCLGSFLNTGAEVQRWLWKRHPENRGHLYTGGLFSLSMHINYFGDVLWVTGYALVAGNPWGAILPVVLFCFFAFFNAPKLDQHLAQHYGAELEAYAKKTRKLVPFLY